MTKQIVLNILARQSEAKWHDIFDGFYEAVVPTLFKWTGWAMLLGGLAHIQSMTGSRILLLLVVILTALLMMHVIYCLSRIVVIWEREPLQGERAFKPAEKAFTLLLLIPLLAALFLTGNETRSAVRAIQSSPSEAAAPTETNK